jgi:hypothetical protein
MPFKPKYIKSSKIVPLNPNCIFNKLKNKKSSYGNGCKGFAIEFFIEYIRQIKTPCNTDKCRDELLRIEMNMSKNINNLLSVLPNETNYLHDMTIEQYNEFTSDSIVFCSIVRPYDGLIEAIHTFILYNGNTIYNSWSSDTSI